MKDRKASVPAEHIPLVVLIPIDDHRSYTKARRLLRVLMGGQAPSLQTLLLCDLHGRDPEGIVDNYLDAIAWPLEFGRSVTLRLRPRARRAESTVSRRRRPGRVPGPSGDADRP